MNRPTTLRLLTGLILLLVFGVLAGRWPLRLPAQSPTVATALAGRDAGHPVAVVVDLDGVRGSNPSRPAERWADAEWVNLLTQTFGGCDLLDLRDLKSTLDGRSLVVIGRRTARSLDESGFELLSAAVDAGLHVLVEAPDSGLCRNFGLELAAVERRQRLPWPKPMMRTTSALPGLHPGDLPVRWTRLRYTPQFRPVAERPRVEISLDGRPLGWSTRQGEGTWIVLAMDLAELSTRLRQGETDDRFRIPEDAEGETRLATLSLVQDPVAANFAWLDAWAEGVLGAALPHSPLPRISTTGFNDDGWLVLSTATDLQAPPGLPLTRYAPMHGTAPGLLGRPPETVRSADSPFAQRIGPSWYQPLWRPRSTAAQRTTQQIHKSTGGSWAPSVDKGFAQVAGAGLQIDSSFGPGATNNGWPFGSSMPFIPLARDGKLFPLLEVPVNARLGSVDLPAVDRWLRANASGSAGPLHLFLEPTEQLDWSPLEALSDRHKHRAAEVQVYAEWWRKRAGVKVWTRPTPEGCEVLVGEIPEDAAGFALLVPTRWRERALTGWEADWGSARSRRVRRHDHEFRLVELTPRASGGALQLIYR